MHSRFLLVEGEKMAKSAGNETMSLSGKSGGTVLRGLDSRGAREVVYVVLFPNVLLSLHPDYVMTHLLTPVGPRHTRVRCSWAFSPEDLGRPGFDPSFAVDFWDLTNRQDFSACESVQRGLALGALGARSARPRRGRRVPVRHHGGEGLPGTAGVGGSVGYLAHHQRRGGSPMSNEVRAVVARSKGAPVSLEFVLVPDPGPGEALVRVQACGVCHTDLHYREGGINDDFPFLLGHEAAGVVESVGPDVTSVAPGDFVVLNWRAVCGECRSCRRGRPWYCFSTHNATQKMTLPDGTVLSPAARRRSWRVSGSRRRR